MRKRCSFIQLKGENLLFNYTKYSFEQRERIKNNLFKHKLTKKQIKKLKKSTVILVDDIYVTGSIINQNIRMLKHIGVKIIFVCTLSKCTEVARNKYPHIEYMINSASIKNLEDLVSLTKQKGWKITTRAMRDLVFAEPPKARSAIKAMSIRVRKNFIKSLKSDNYQNIKETRVSSRRVIKYLKSA